MSTRPCEGGCGTQIGRHGGRQFCVRCKSKRDSARKVERRRSIREAARSGAPRPPPKPHTLYTRSCKTCGKAYSTRVARSVYCSTRCGERHRYVNRVLREDRVNAPRDAAFGQRTGGIGPAKPLIATDWDGMLRRAVRDAAAGLSSSALRERGVPDKLVRKAMKLAGVDEKRRRNGDFSSLPFGPPV